MILPKYCLLKHALFLLFIFIYPTVVPLVSADTNPNEIDDEVYRLEEISVTPGRFSISDSAQSPYIMSKADMEKLPLIDNDIGSVVREKAEQ